MYRIHDQRNIYESLEYDAFIGPYVSTIIHDRKFIQGSYRPWIEVYPYFTHNWHTEGYTTHHTHEPSPQFHQKQPAPKQPSPKQPSPKQSSPKQPSQKQPAPKQYSSSIFSPEQFSPESPSPRTQSLRQPSPRTRHYVPGMTEKELEEKRKEAGWYPGCEDEPEEEEPDFWEFFRKLAKETDERILQSQREYEEEYDNYFVARFAFH